MKTGNIQYDYTTQFIIKAGFIYVLLLIIIIIVIVKATYVVTNRKWVGLRGHWGGASQFGFVHAAHEFLQFDGERHVAFDPQLPRHEGQRRLQLP